LEQQPKRVVPTFATEAEEAEWWYNNRNIHGKQLLAAAKNDEAQVLTKEKLRERIAASRKTPAPTVSLRIPEADLALPESRPSRRDCLTTPTSNRYCTKRSPSEKGKRWGGRRAE
jgi:hypothetical protein